MKKNHVLKFILLIQTVVVITSFYLVPFSEDEKERVLTKANQYIHQYPQEKVYLHTDRPLYWANEDIWYKAYLKNTPIKNCNLYVELLNSKGKVIYKNTGWVQDGFSYGNMHLADTLSSGIYQLRAYTSWMRNFDEEWFFRKDLVIWNLRDKSISSETEELKARKVNFQFMPEGGTFLSGINNRVAFKVNDRNGKGLDVEGVILDEKGNEIAKIKSGYKGMGSFELTPQAGMKYTAEVLVAGNINMNINLPEATVSGVAMKINPEKTDRIQVEINESGLPSEGKYLVVGQVEGKVSYQKEVLVNSGKSVLEISKNEFPTGIVRLTLFDNQMIPRCERLVFVNHNDQIEVKIEPEETEYHPREKVIIDLYTLEKDDKPVLANLSFSAYLTEITPETEIYPENIMTRFLLSSELKGRVEEPAFYFKDDSLFTIIALDNLLLTHGYRYFGWEEITDNHYQPEISWQPDSSIEIKGKVISFLTNRPVPNSKVIMMTVKSLLDVREQEADSAGNFVIPNFYFYDTIQVSLQSRNPNGKTNTEIKLDESVTSSPETNILPLTYQYSKENQSTTVTYLSELTPELRNKKWHLSDTILLGDINVVTRKKKEYDGYARPYLEADYVIDATLFEDTNGNIIETLEMNSPIFRMFMNRGARVFFDGSSANGSMPASWIDKVELVRMAPIPGAGFEPAVFFWSKRGAPNKVPKFASGISTTKLVGYSVIRNFYSPVYDGSEDTENQKGDFRSTLYWNPVIETDEDGVGWVSFYNSDQTGEVKVVVEGVTKTGKLCRGVYKYVVIPE